MGTYINHPTQDKWDFVSNVAVKSLVPEEAKAFRDFEGPNCLVCVIQNGQFTAAAVAYNEVEVQDFTRDEDTRLREYYLVPKDTVRPFASGRLE